MRLPDPLSVRAREEERMDDPALDQGTFTALLSDLGRANALTLAARPTIAFVRRASGRADEPLRVLDVGSGGGDTLRALARWCAWNRIKAELVGVDLNPLSKAAAEAHPAPLPIEHRTGDYGDQAGPWDVVLSSLVAHHMTEAELVRFLRWMEATARVGWLVNDLRRSAIARAGFRALSTVAGWHPIVRHDGALSVARSWREGDWRVLLDEAGLGEAGVRVRRWFPYRLCVERLR